MNNKLLEIKAQKQKVGNKILKIDPQKFLLEYAKEVLRNMDVNCSNIDSPDKLKEVVSSLPKTQFKEFNEELEITKKMYENACIELKYGKCHPFIKILKSSIVKGAEKGVFAAGIINFVAPGAIPTLWGYFASKDPSMWGKIGKLLTGICTPQPVNKLAVLGVSAAVGGVIGGACGIAKGIKKTRAKQKASSIQER